MAKYGSDDVFLLIGGYDISGNSFALNEETEAIEEETHGFGDIWVERTAVGVYKGGVSHESFYDDAALQTNAAALAALGVNTVLVAGLEGNTQGRKVIGYEGALETKFSRLPKRGELTKISAEYMGSGFCENPKIVQILAAQSAAGTGSSGSLDNTAGTSNGGSAYLELTGLTLGGYTSVTIKIQQSSDNGGGDPFSDLVTFTNVVGASPGATWAQRAVVNPGTTVERYLRATITWNGAGSGQSVTYVVAFERK